MKKFLIILCAVLLVQSSAFAAMQEPTPEQIKYRQELKESKINFKASVFSMLVSKGDCPNVEKFLKAGMNPDTKYVGEPAIFTAIRTKQDKVFDLLLQYGADIKGKHALDTTLEWALISKNSYACKQLLDKGIKPTPYAISMARKSKDETIRSLFPKEEAPKICTIQPMTRQQQTNQAGRITMNAVKKDPKLIIIPIAQPVDNNLFNKKMTADNPSYSAIKPKLTEEQYKIYRIVEKIVRANNLEFQNWRIGFDMDPEEINASSSTANLILISSALYDSINQNQDALAMVISHEIAHFLLGHHQTALENDYKIRQAQAQAERMSGMASQQNQLGSLNNIYGNRNASLGNSVAALGYVLGASSEQGVIDDIYKQEREQEYQADIEAVDLMTRAGYDVHAGLEGFQFLSTIPSYYTSRSNHPQMQDRISNINSLFASLDENELANEGRANLYNSNVLECVKSMDKKTIVINKPARYTKVFYSADTEEEKYLRKGYVAYTRDNLGSAIELFKKANELNGKGDLAPLYLSYIYEELYYKTRDKKDLRTAYNWAYKAASNWKSEYTLAQKTEMEKLYYGRS